MNERSYLLSLTEVTQSVHIPVETIVVIVEHGIVEPRGQRPKEWQFEPHMLATLRQAMRLHRDLEMDWAGIAVALSLIDKLRQLRGENKLLRQQLIALDGTRQGDYS
jgi:chaperone modulatory protein CbpM